MAQKPLDHCDVHAPGKCQRCEGVPKLVEAENEAILVEVENRIWYNLLKDYGYAIVLFV